MHPVVAKTFGGLSRQYYIRQFLFGCIFLAIILFMTFAVGSHPHGRNYGMIVFAFINTVLYPYSRFVYESIFDYIIGRNIFILPAFMMLILKLMTMLLCWAFAVFIAPIGLVYLYIHHSRAGGNVSGD